MSDTKDWIYLIGTPVVAIGLLAFQDYPWAGIAFAAWLVLLYLKISKTRKRNEAESGPQPRQAEGHADQQVPPARQGQ